MNTLSEPPSQPFISRLRATLTHAKHPVFRFQSIFFIAAQRPSRRTLPYPAF